MRIMVVDDDPEIVSLVRRRLAYEGYTVETAGDGVEAVEKARLRQPDLVVLDVMMPGMDGLEVSRFLRGQSDVPIIMLTARSSIADRVAGLDSGADDYLIKPFAFDELLARIRALLRRREPEDIEVVRFADLSLNTATREVKCAGHSIELSTREFDLLELLMRNPRRILKRERILEQVWGPDFVGDSNVMEVYIRYLRSKLEAVGMSKLIHTVRGVGYIMKDQGDSDGASEPTLTGSQN